MQMSAALIDVATELEKLLYDNSEGMHTLPSVFVKIADDISEIFIGDILVYSSEMEEGPSTEACWDTYLDEIANLYRLFKNSRGDPR